MFKKYLLVLCVALINFAYADFTTGRNDAFNIHHGKTSSSDVDVIGYDWNWDLPVSFNSNITGFLLFGINNWKDNSVAKDSFVGLHLAPGLRFSFPIDGEYLMTYLDVSVGVAYFGRKDFGNYYQLDNDFKMELNLVLGATFGQQDEYEIGLGYSHYFADGGSDIEVGPSIYLGYHF